MRSLHYDLEQLRIELVGESKKYLDAPGVACSDDRDKGISPTEGFDCSGFVSFLLDQIGFPRPPEIRWTAEYFDGFGVPVHYGMHAPGDLVFFSKKGLVPMHMGIVIEGNNYIHAIGADNGKVCISSIRQKPIKPHPERYAEQLYLENPIGFRRLALPGSHHKSKRVHSHN